MTYKMVRGETGSGSYVMTSDRFAEAHDLRIVVQRAFEDVLARPGSSVTVKRVNDGGYELLGADES